MVRPTMPAPNTAIRICLKFWNVKNVRM